MKCISFFSFFFFLAVSGVWAAEYTEIECKIMPIQRKKTSTAPHIRLKEGLSTNWSGYAAATSLTNPLTGSVTKVSGSWTVPALSPSRMISYSSAWVGIDGYTSTTVEQIGTEHDYYFGRQQNYAWFEMYPGGSYELGGFPTNVGDQISATVTYQGNNVFQLTIVNNTKKVSFTIPSSYTTSASTKRSSAEWVVEAPSNGYSILPLANFRTITMSNCIATINGVSGPINNSAWKNDAITMVTPYGVQKAQPSALTSNGEGFSVTWKHQ